MEHSMNSELNSNAFEVVPEEEGAAPKQFPELPPRPRCIT